MEKETIRYNHANPLDGDERFMIIVWSLIALLFYAVDSETYILCLVLAAKNVYQLARKYWLKSKASHALILTDEYIQAPCRLVSKYTYPIAWNDIKAIIGTIEKKSKGPSENSLLLLKNRAKFLGEVTKWDIKKARKLSKKYFAAGLFEDDNFDSDDASAQNYEYFQNSILFDLSFIADKDGELIKKLEHYSHGPLYGFDESDRQPNND